MTIGKDDSFQSINVQLNGKNYSYWSYVMKRFYLEKSMWGYVSSVKGKPIDTKVDNYAITWVNNSITHLIDAQLGKYDTLKDVWDHLSRLYNFDKQYQLETNICALKQNDMNIHDFYSTMTTPWDQLAFTEPAKLSAFTLYIIRRESQHLVIFLMALCSDFESLCGSILHRNPRLLLMMLLMNY